jgi:hypothetical protein
MGQHLFATTGGLDHPLKRFAAAVASARHQHIGRAAAQP